MPQSTIFSETKADSTTGGSRVASILSLALPPWGGPRSRRNPTEIEYLAVSDTIHLMSDNERSVIDPEPTFLKVIIDARSRHLLGCLVAGDDAPVIVNIAAMAMNSGVEVERLREISLVQPSAADALMSVLRKLT